MRRDRQVLGCRAPEDLRDHLVNESTPSGDVVVHQCLLLLFLVLSTSPPAPQVSRVKADPAARAPLGVLGILDPPAGPASRDQWAPLDLQVTVTLTRVWATTLEVGGLLWTIVCSSVEPSPCEDV